MHDLNDPRIPAPQRRLLLPAPPGSRHKQSKTERKRQAEAEARAARLHLVGLTNAWMIVMGLVLATVVIMFVVVLISHH
jgi:hypothetical protein